MSLEQKINYQLNKFPKAKKYIKRIYQYGMYSVSPKFKSKGDIICVSPDDGKEYFFGYYDKTPWDASGDFMLCLRANNTWSDVSPNEPAEILLINTKNNSIKKLAETFAWNVQQGCMLQWLGPDFSSKIIYNDCRGGKYVSVILEVNSGKETILPAPVYTVSGDGKTALTLDFSRLYNLRPGYGYRNIREITEGVALPNTPCIWRVDIGSGVSTPILQYSDFANFLPRDEMLEKNAVHKVNHLMLSPDGTRFMVLYRWFNGQRKYTRLITCSIDGNDMFLLSDDDMVSHCCWKNNSEILAFANKAGSGIGYYLMYDRTNEYKHLWKSISSDGHPSYSPKNNSLVVTDTYPSRNRICEINILKDDDSGAMNYKTIAQVFAPFKYDNDTRCDLHPRWSRDGEKICFDAVFEGHRGLYVVEVNKENE